jgi:PIN domain nuclease of toxin-antitoxin system
VIVLDTHVLLWYFLDDPRLPVTTRDLMTARPRDMHVPSVCLWEAMMLAETGRISLPKGKADRLLRKYLSESGFTEAPLTADIALLSRTLAFNHADPADRFIAATAKMLGFPLATSDAMLRGLGWLKLAY